MIRNTLFILFFLLAAGSFAQELSTKNKKAIQYFNQTEYMVIRREYIEAIQLLEMALEKDSKFIEAHLRIGSCYRAINELDRALYHYQQLVVLEPDNRKYMGGYYGLAEVYFKLGRYEDAIPLLRQFLKYRPNVAARDEARELLNDAEYAQEGVKHPIPFSPKPLPGPINQLPLQYFPVLTADGNQLVFTGRKGFGAIDDEDIYIAQKVNGVWGAPGSISPSINTLENEGTSTISADGRIMIFTSCAGRAGYGSCDLYMTVKSGDTWQKPINLGDVVNSPSWDSQPSLSADGRTLYFVSNRPGGQGLRDIWVTYLNETEQWSSPVNLGPGINTPEDEVSPFIHANGQTLYFASKGYPGFGGFDIYKSERGTAGWSKPENLGYPLNTSDDQLSLFISADGNTGLYSFEKRLQTQFFSYLYEFEVPDEIRASKAINYVYGRVLDEQTEHPLAARVELRNLATGKPVNLVFSDSISGEYLITLTEGAQYGLYVERKGYLFKSLSFDYQKGPGQEPVKLDVYLEPIISGSITTLNNIFFEFDQYQLQKTSRVELMKVVNFLKENPEIRVEISGHTDNTGDAGYNQKLSENRAQAVYEYLISQGIPEDRISYKGYGESQPLVPNDTEENKSRNRRIAFTIL